jgi:DHA1 family bicyclomycin/chloramphenicol resistance-like MFS transporter
MTAAATARRRTAALGSRMPSTTALVLVTGVGPFATDAYIGGLPGLRESLGTTATVAQLTLTAFIVGLAAGQLVLGAVSDATGRRGLLLACAIVFAVLSAVCAFAPSGLVLVAARLGEGIAAGGGVVVSRAVVTDTHDGPAAAAKFGTLASITFFGPILAPVIGGLVLSHGSWRIVFAGLTGFGVVMVAAVLVGLPESLDQGKRHSSGVRNTAARMAGLVRDWSFMKHVAVYCLSAAGFFTYIGGSSFVLETTFHVSPGQYSIIFATNAGAMAVAAVVFRVLVRRTGPARLRTIGLTSSTFAAVGLLAVAIAAPGASIAIPWVLLCVVVAGTGFTVPATTALAQEAGRRYAGTAASLQGGLGFLVGAAVTPLTGFIGYHSLLPLAVAMTVFYLASFALLRVVTGRATA